MTRATIQKIPKDHGVLLAGVHIIISIQIYVKWASRDRVVIEIML
jgi:hypothetical protein